MSSIYLVLIGLVMLFSWVGNIYGLMLPDGTLLPSILSNEGVRWMVRHSIANIAAAPLAEVLLVLLLVGALRSSGLWHAWCHMKHLEQRRRHALIVASVVMMMTLGIVFLGIRPGGNLLSVTGHLYGGPFASGWLFLLTLVVVIPAIVYGKMCEVWHTSDELYEGLSSDIFSAASYFVTLVVASQLVATIRYVQLFPLIGLSPTMQSLCIGLIYAIPLILLFVKKRNT